MVGDYGKQTDMKNKGDDDNTKRDKRQTRTYENRKDTGLNNGLQVEIIMLEVENFAGAVSSVDVSSVDVSSVDAIWWFGCHTVPKSSQTFCTTSSAKVPFKLKPSQSHLRGTPWLGLNLGFFLTV
jgi:hypothetical protein